MPFQTPLALRSAEGHWHRPFPFACEMQAPAEAPALRRTLVLRCCLKRESMNDTKKQKASEHKHNREPGIWFLSAAQHLEGSEDRKAMPKPHLLPPSESKLAGMAVTQLHFTTDSGWGFWRAQKAPRWLTASCCFSFTTKQHK